MLKEREARTISNMCKSSYVNEDARINPKGYFANERTFLHWQSLALTMGGLGIGLLNFGEIRAQLSGTVFCSIAMAFSIYSLSKYLERSDLLSSKQRGISYEDIRGSLLLVLVVFVAIGINFMLHFSH